MNEGPRHELLMGVPLTLSAELGRCSLRVRELLELGVGAVVHLDREADAPVDLLVNGTIVARGEVVAVDGRFGVRITELRA